MTPLRTTLTLLLLVAAVLLAAGCAGQKAGVIPANSVQPVIQNGTGSYRITIDPISDKLVGSKFSITANTNLPVDDQVQWEITSRTFNREKFIGKTSIMPVIPGENGLNKTVLDIDSAKLLSEDGGEYIIIERAVRENAKDVAPFSVHRILYTIDFNAIGDKRFGDKFTVMGITNLPAGGQVAVTIQSSGNTSSVMTGAATIVKGNEDLNITSFTVDTTNFLPVAYDEYRISERYSQQNIAVERQTDFRISNGSPRPLFISIDPNLMLMVDEDGIFRSTTNLPVGDEVFWEIRSQPAPGALVLNGTAMVTKGKADLNETSFTVEASVFSRTGNSRYLLTERSKMNEVQDQILFNILPIP